MDPLDFVRLLLEPDRLAVLGAVAREWRTAAETAAHTGLAERTVLEVLATARQHGVVEAAGGSYRLDAGVLRQVAASCRARLRLPSGSATA